jgi:hypothetical protein
LDRPKRGQQKPKRLHHQKSKRLHRFLVCYNDEDGVLVEDIIVTNASYDEVRDAIQEWEHASCIQIAGIRQTKDGPVDYRSVKRFLRAMEEWCGDWQWCPGWETFRSQREEIIKNCRI